MMAAETIVDGPCLVCDHVDRNGVLGYCPMFNRTVRALNGCSDFGDGQVVHFKADTWSEKLQLKGDSHEHPQTQTAGR